MNISISIQSDNKAIIEVTLDRKDKDYFACDAGCLDIPVKLSNTEVTTFPVKLTDPVTAVLYITADYAHMQNLRHTIHVKEVAHGKLINMVNITKFTVQKYLFNIIIVVL